MTFKEQIITDAKTVFMDTETGFAENISYLPYEGESKTIAAVVNRGMLEPNKQGELNAPGREFEIIILNDATEGIANVQKGQDEVSLPVWPGGDNVTWAVVDIMSKDEAVYVLKIRR